MRACNNCGKEVPAQTSIGSDAPPVAGDFCVCWYCGSIGKVDADNNLSKLEPQDFLDLYLEDEELFFKMQKVAHAIRFKNKYMK